MTDDDQLRRLLSDAVSDVEPHERLTQIRDSVRADPEVVPMSRPRSWRYAVVGVAATVAVIGGVAVASGALQSTDNAGDHTPTGPGPSGHQTTGVVTPPSSSGSPGPTTPTSGTSVEAGSRAYAVYYVGDGPTGRPVLFREFHAGPDVPSADPGGNGGDVLTEAVQDALGSQPLDPDYRSPWSGRVTLDYASYTTTGGGYTLQIALNGRRSLLAVRPADVTAAEARAAVQQLVYTAQAAIGKRVPVTITIGHRPPDQHETLWGVDVTHPIANGPVLRTLSLVNISSPNEDQQVSGHLTVTGVNNSFEGSSVIYLERDGTKYLVTPVIGGFGPGRLYPWTAHLDLSKVSPGQYTLVARNDDPSGRGNPATDTRTIIVR